jgi:NAD(P)-dependent dehydrogenase (short-subunit alcohol dehydrogenase family)
MDAVVTGASTGIGQACTLLLDRAGWRVFAGVRRKEDGERLRAQTGSRFVPVILDVTDEGSVSSAAERIRDELGTGGLKGLVNNAGIAVAGPLEFIPLDDWRRQLEVNVIGVVAVTQAFLPLLREAKGRIVNMGSVGGRSSTPFVGPYAASKYALEGINDALRRELRKWGMWVAIIEPGSIDTPIWDKGRRDAEAQIEALPARARELYGSDLAGVQKAIVSTSARGLAPEKVAEAVHHALTAKRPRARYLIGREAQGRVLAESVLPARAFDALIARAMGLGR